MPSHDVTLDTANLTLKANPESADAAETLGDRFQILVAEAAERITATLRAENPNTDVDVKSDC